MAEKKVIIIGAGIAGLSSGCYLQMNGYDTRIFEQHSLPGGLCTSWVRGGYHFDGCLHSFGALKPGYRLNQWWNEVIDLGKMEFHFPDELSRVFLEDGRLVQLHTDPDRLEDELKRIAPEDCRFIEDLIRAVKHFSREYDLQLAKPIELWTPLDYFLSQFRNAPHLGFFVKWQHSIAHMTRDCRSETLKRVLNEDFFSHFPAYFMLISLAEMHKHNAGYPIGGSLQIPLKMEETYARLGGKIHYNSPVRRVDVLAGHARGVTLENGEQYEAEVVVSAADGHQTIFGMLDGRFVDQKVRQRYAEHAMWPSMVLVSLGLKRTFEREPGVINIQLRDPFVVDEVSKLTSLPVIIYNFDPTLAEEGKTCLRVILKTPGYQHWYELRQNDPSRYEEEKSRLADALIDILDERIGAIRDQVEVVDVATPATFMRYTRNWKGSTQGWDWLPGLIPGTMSKTLPGLKGFYMAGQWVSPGGGVSAAFVSGRDIARIICKKDGKRFKTV